MVGDLSAVGGAPAGGAGVALGAVLVPTEHHGGAQPSHFVLPGPCRVSLSSVIDAATTIPSTESGNNAARHVNSPWCSATSYMWL